MYVEAFHTCQEFEIYAILFPILENNTTNIVKSLDKRRIYYS